MKVDRTTKWGNPFRWLDFKSPAVTELQAKKLAVEAFREMLFTTEFGIKLRADAKKELRGKDLMCWCGRGEYCHADVLLQAANGRLSR